MIALQKINKLVVKFAQTNWTYIARCAVDFT